MKSITSLGRGKTVSMELARGVPCPLLQRLCNNLVRNASLWSRNLLPSTSQYCGSRTHEFLFKYSRMHDILNSPSLSFSLSLGFFYPVMERQLRFG